MLYYRFIYKKTIPVSVIIGFETKNIINSGMTEKIGRPRSWTVYFTINQLGEIYHVFHSNEPQTECNDIRKYKSGLSKHDSFVLTKIMRNYYKISNYHINVEEVSPKLKYLKFPPKTHKSRLTPSWNKGLKTNKKYKTSSSIANRKIENKKNIWLLNTFVQKACTFCFESEINCLSYYPDMTEIKKINKYLGLGQPRDSLLKTIEIQKVVCLNCLKKLDIGLELV